LDLLPLAQGKAGDDPDDELMGSGLRAVWPKHLSADELFKIIHYPKQPNLHGTYHLFIHFELSQNLSPDHLPAGMNWVQSQEYRHDRLDPMVKLADRIITAAWDVAEPGTALWNQVARAILDRLKHHAVIVRRKDEIDKGPLWLETDPRRRSLLQTLMPMCGPPEFPPAYLLFTEPPVAISGDIPWMLTLARGAASETERNIWLGMVLSAFGLGMHHLDDILSAMDDPDVAKFFQPHLLQFRLIPRSLTTPGSDGRSTRN
jgi:hypothetical protein